MSHSISHSDAKQMINEYRRHPRAVYGSTDNQGNLVEVKEFHFAKSALQVFVGVNVDYISIFMAVNSEGRDSSGNLTFPSDPAKQTFTPIMAGIKDGAIIHSTLLDYTLPGPPDPVTNP